MKNPGRILLLVLTFLACNLSIAHGSDSTVYRGIAALGMSASGDTYELQVTPVGNPDGYRAAALNVTVVDGEAAAVGGYVTVFPCGDRPTASNVNFVDGQTVPNAVIAPVSADGRVCLYVYGKAHVVVDVAGYFSSGFSALAKPERFLDTRTSGVKVGKVDGSGEPYSLVVGGVSGVPSGVSTVALNVTVVDGEADAVGGYVTVFPCGDRPTASNVNFVDGQTVPNAVIAPVSADGRVCLYVYGKAHVVVDVAGYFSSGFSALAKPERFLDTRTSGVKVGEPVKNPEVPVTEPVKNPGVPLALGLDLTGASALVQTSGVSVRSVMENRVPYTVSLSNLYKVTSDGSVEPVATTNSFNVQSMAVGPDGNVYTVLTGSECVLAVTRIEDSASFCIESNARIWSSNEIKTLPVIQFDDDGGVYYGIMTPRSDGRAPYYDYKIRRFRDGVAINMFEIPNQTIRFWHASPNGTVLFSGQVLDYDAAGEQYEVNHDTKLVTSDLKVSVVSTGQANFFSDFGTDLVYFGICDMFADGFQCGHRKFNPTTSQVAAEYHLTGRNNSVNASRENNADVICDGYSTDIIGDFCGSYGTAPGPFSSTANGKYFARIDGIMRQNAATRLTAVFQYFPTVQPVLASVTKSRVITTLNNDLFLAGTTSAGDFSTVKIDGVSGSESTMLSITDGIDVVELEAVGSENRLYFRGTRVAGGSEVIGFVNLTTGVVTIQNFTQGSILNIEAVAQ